MPPQPPSPPINTPQIAQVLEPGAGLYSVYVRMANGLTSKFPNKAFNLTITEIGLAPKDAERFAGYVLVGFESMKGSPDLLWVFESLPGAVWDTVSNSRENLTPQKFRAQTTITKTKQDVVPGTAPDELTGDKVASTVERQENTGKSVKIDVTEVIDENASPLLGERFAPDGAVLSVSEQLVVDGTSTDRGVNIASSEVDALGNGKSVKQTQTAKRRTTSDATEVGWPKKQKKRKGVESLTPQKYRALTTTDVSTTQVELAAADVNDIPEPATPTGDVTTVEHEKINDHRYEQRVVTEVIDENAGPLVGDSFQERGFMASEESLVVDGTDATAGFTIADSNVEPIGNGKSIKQTRTARTRNTSDAIVDGWSTGQKKSVGQDNLTPAKFRGQVVASVTKTQESLAASEVNDIPDPAAPTGDQTLIEHEKVNDYRYEKRIITEEIAELSTPLAGQQFAPNGVIIDTSESLVVDGTLADTGLTIADSVVSPLGNGKSIKQTNTAKRRTTGDATETGWPKKQKKSKGQPSLIPAKYRGLVTSTETTEQVALAAAEVDDIPEPPALSGDEVLIENEKVNDYRYEKRTVLETIDELSGALTGNNLTRYGNISETSEELVPDATAPITPDYLTIGFSDEPLGNGKSVRSIETVSAFAELQGTETDFEFNVSTPYTTQIVAAGTTSTNPMEEFTPIDELRTQKRTFELPPNIETFELAFPVKANLQLPRILKSVSVVWNTSIGNGDMDATFSGSSVGKSFSLSCHQNDTASASRALQPELMPEIEEVSTDGMYCTAKVFYLPMPVTTADILTRTSASLWPVFRPVAHTLIAFGQNVDLRCNAGIDGESSGALDDAGAIVHRSMSAGESTSSNIAHSVSSNVQRLQPTIHGDITLTDASREETFSATAVLSASGTNFPPLAASITKTASVAGAVYPDFLPATTPAALPTSGTYLVDSKVSPYKWGYAKVYVELFDATQLA